MADAAELKDKHEAVIPELRTSSAVLLPQVTPLILPGSPPASSPSHPHTSQPVTVHRSSASPKLPRSPSSPDRMTWTMRIERHIDAALGVYSPSTLRDSVKGTAKQSTHEQLTNGRQGMSGGQHISTKQHIIGRQHISGGYLSEATEPAGKSRHALTPDMPAPSSPPSTAARRGRAPSQPVPITPMLMPDELTLKPLQHLHLPDLQQHQWSEAQMPQQQTLPQQQQQQQQPLLQEQQQQQQQSPQDQQASSQHQQGRQEHGDLSKQKHTAEAVKDGAAEFLSLWELHAKLPEPFDPRPLVPAAWTHGVFLHAQRPEQTAYPAHELAPLKGIPAGVQHVSTQQLQEYFREQQQKAQMIRQQERAQAAEQARQQELKKQQQRERQQQLFALLQAQVQRAPAACSHLSNMSVYSSNKLPTTPSVHSPHGQHGKQQQQQQQQQESQEHAEGVQGGDFSPHSIPPQAKEQTSTTAPGSQQEETAWGHHQQREQQQPQQREAAASWSRDQDQAGDCGQQQLETDRSHELEPPGRCEGVDRQQGGQQHLAEQQPPLQIHATSQQQQDGLQHLAEQQLPLQCQAANIPAQPTPLPPLIPNPHLARAPPSPSSPPRAPPPPHLRIPSSQNLIPSHHSASPTPSPLRSQMTSPISSRPSSAHLRVVQGTVLAPGTICSRPRSAEVRGAPFHGLMGLKYNPLSQSTVSEGDPQQEEGPQDQLALQSQVAHHLYDTMARQQLLHAGEQDSKASVGNLLLQPPHIARPAENYDQVLLHQLPQSSTEFGAGQEDHATHSRIDIPASATSEGRSAPAVCAFEENPPSDVPIHTPHHPACIAASASPEISSSLGIAPSGDLIPAHGTHSTNSASVKGLPHTRPHVRRGVSVPAASLDQDDAMPSCLQPAQSVELKHGRKWPCQQDIFLSVPVGLERGSSQGAQGSNDAQDFGRPGPQDSSRRLPISVSQLLGDAPAIPGGEGTLFGGGSSYSTLLPPTRNPAVSSSQPQPPLTSFAKSVANEGPFAESAAAGRQLKRKGEGSNTGFQPLKSIPRRVYMSASGRMIFQPQKMASMSSPRQDPDCVEFRSVPTLASTARMRAQLFRSPASTPRTPQHPSPQTPSQAIPSAEITPRTPLSPRLLTGRLAASLPSSQACPPKPHSNPHNTSPLQQLLESESEDSDEVVFDGGAQDTARSQESNGGLSQGGTGSDAGTAAPHHHPTDPAAHARISAASRAALSHPFTSPTLRIMTSMDTPAPPLPSSTSKPRNLGALDPHPRPPTRVGASGAIPTAPHTPHWGSTQLARDAPWAAGRSSAPLKLNGNTSPSSQHAPVSSASSHSLTPTMLERNSGRSMTVRSSGRAAKATGHSNTSRVNAIEDSNTGTLAVRADVGTKKPIGTPGLIRDSPNGASASRDVISRVAGESRPGNCQGDRPLTGSSSSSKRCPSPAGLQREGLRMLVAKTVPGATLEETEPVQIPPTVEQQDSAASWESFQPDGRARPKVARGPPLPVSLLQADPQYEEFDEELSAW